MRKTVYALAPAAAVVIVMMAAWSPAAAQGLAALDVSDANSIRAYLTNWTRQMLRIDNAADMIKAHKDLVDAYTYSDKSDAGYNFANAVSTIVAPLLDKFDANDPLRVAKEVNVALALAAMPQVTIQPALEKMVVHRNPAVRLEGWRGYAAARTRICGHAGQAKTMLASLSAAAKNEKSPVVLGAMFLVMKLEADKPGDVDVAVWDALQKQMFGDLQKNWRTWCALVRCGDPDMIEAADKAVAALAAHAALIPKDRPETKAVLQMLVDMAWCAAKVYQENEGAGPASNSAVLVLRDFDKTLKSITGLDKPYIEKPLSDPRMKPSDLVWTTGLPHYGVLAWVEELKDQGVKEPRIEKPVSTTAGSVSVPAPATTAPAQQ